jgi:hypothetical protein
MPVETLASFVTEQAVGIVIGGVAVVAARKFGPKLAIAPQESRLSGPGAVSERRGVAIIGTVPVVVASPVKTAGQVLYEQVERYGEQWKDLIAEAHAMQATGVNGNDMSTANVLAGLPEANVVCDLPGRLRLRLLPLKGDEELAVAYVAALAGMPGISQVQFNRHSGSILIGYDPGRYASSDLLRQAFAATCVSAGR